MAEEKHRMLFQGQDPTQPVGRSLLHLAPGTAAAAPTERQRPPTYDDAMGHRSQLDLPLQQPKPMTVGDHRHTYCVETQQEHGPARPELMAQPHSGNDLAGSTAARLPPALPDLAVPQQPQQPQLAQLAQLAQQPQQEQPTLTERVHVPPVRSFTGFVPQPKLGAKACSVVCPACGRAGRTRRRCTPNTRTHCWSLWLCSVGWCCCACLCPYLMDSCRTTSHYCTSCKTFLGSHYPDDCCH